jgi:hypothetical protein
MESINSVVAQTSPNIYSAAKNANLSPIQTNQVEQMSFAIQKHKELMAMKPDDATNAYRKLDPSVQDGLKFLYKDAQYAAPAPTLGSEVTGALKYAGKTLASPIIGLFKIAGNYNRLINTPYLVGREIAQGDGSIFNKKIWKSAWDGNSIFDNKAIGEATKIYGATDVEVAKGLLAGKTPGEIIQAHGTVDQAMLDSITKAFDTPNKFKDVMDTVKFAQVSPGRDLFRMLDDRPVGGLGASHVSGFTKFMSGAVDAVYQIAIDPLTWVSGGLDKAPTLGLRLAKSIEESARAGDLAGGVSKVMQNPAVNTLWEKQLGPAIQRYATAEGAAAKDAAYKDIARTFPGYANRDVIRQLASPDAQVFNAKAAEKYFSQAENTHLMLSGRVDGVTYARNGIATAKTTRNFTEGFTTYLDSIFNPTESRTLGALKTQGRDISKVDELGKPLYETLIKTGQSLDKLVHPNPELDKVLADINGEIKGLKAFGYKIGQQATRSPAGAEIRLGDRSAETANHFNNMARQLLPRDMAGFMTEKFIDAPMDEQVVILRNVYASIMHKFGMGGTQAGRDLMEKILRDKFGGSAGFATMKDTGIPEHMLNQLEPTSIKEVNGVKTLDSESAIQPYHTTHVIGALPYDKIAEHVAGVKSQQNLFNAVLGIGSGKFARKAVDAWSMLTLLPRLGIRSAIDESMMFMLTAHPTDLLRYATFEGKRMGRFTTAFTGSKTAVGPIQEMLGKVLPKVDPSNALAVEQRQALINKMAKDLKVNPDELYDLQKRQAIIDSLKSTYAKHIDTEGFKYLNQALIYHPDMLNSTAQSFVGHSGLSGNYGEDILAGIITPSNLDLALKEEGLKAGRTQRSIDTTSLSENEVALAHFDNWFKGFVANTEKLPNNRIISPATVFLTNNGLRTEADVKKAMDELMSSVGVVFEPSVNRYIVKDQEAVNAFKRMSARSVELNGRVADDVSIVRDQAGRILADLYTTFHGGANKFNESLLAEVKTLKSKLTQINKDERDISWSQAAAGMDYGKFRELTNGFRPEGKINSAIEFEGFKDPESLWRRVGDKGFEWMDRQITAIHRQPALNVLYTEVRKNWSGIERQWVKDHLKAAIAAEPEKYADPKAAARLEQRIMQDGEKRFTELGMNHAADQLLKYADNPAVRSNFAYASRTLGRYYRATEDFQRRMFRLKEVPARVLYRMRLAHLGLSASGSVFTDQQGNPYINVPMDSTLFKATDSTIRRLTGNTGYSQPLFNDFTMKLNMINPSFQQDSGLPMLSGPIAGLGVLAMKNILGYTHNAAAENAGDAISNVALGSFGTNTNLQKVLMPQTLQHVWDMLVPQEQSRQEVTAGQQAIAYNAANGYHLDANATDQQKADYIKNIRISAHNIIFLRNFLGLIAPASTTLTESKGVPDYLKRVGVTSLRSEFYDILDAINQRNNGDIQDPYETALVTFMGKNPGKLVYTVSRSDKQMKVVVKETNQLNQWARDNRNAINTYGEAAYIFAPHVGKLNANSFNYLQAAGLMSSKSLEKYYGDVAVSQDKQAYYDIGINEKAALATEADAYKRQVIIDTATTARQALMTSNPMLKAALIGSGNNVGKETQLLSSLNQMVGDPKANIDLATRTRMNIALKMVNDYLTFAQDPTWKIASNFTDLKKQRREEIEAQLKNMMLGDAYLTEANRAIFEPILKFYSRDTYVAFQKGF